MSPANEGLRKGRYKQIDTTYSATAGSAAPLGGVEGRLAAGVLCAGDGASCEPVRAPPKAARRRSPLPAGRF